MSRSIRALAATLVALGMHSTEAAVFGGGRPMPLRVRAQLVTSRLVASPRKLYVQSLVFLEVPQDARRVP